MFERVGVLVGLGVKVCGRLEAATLVRLGRSAHPDFSSSEQFVDSLEGEASDFRKEEVASRNDQGVKDGEDDLFAELSVLFRNNSEAWNYAKLDLGMGNLRSTCSQAT